MGILSGASHLMVDVRQTGRSPVFEQMHYVCFHYEFEHDPYDPDEECAAGGCPSAAIRPRPERRPDPNATDH
jgi:hypothetical protein